jgi:hypothetical protein
MKTTLIKTYALCLLMGTMLTNCKKGDTGPQGPAGTNGNANVKSTTASNVVWVYSDPDYVTTINVPAITQDILSNGAVLVYINVQGDVYQQLPVTFYPTNSYSETYSVECFVGGVRIYVTDSDLLKPVNQPSNTFKYKIVTIAGSGKIKSVDTKNYKEVASTYGISE